MYTLPDYNMNIPHNIVVAFRCGEFGVGGIVVSVATFLEVDPGLIPDRVSLYVDLDKSVCQITDLSPSNIFT